MDRYFLAGLPGTTKLEGPEEELEELEEELEELERFATKPPACEPPLAVALEVLGGQEAGVAGLGPFRPTGVAGDKCDDLPPLNDEK